MNIELNKCYRTRDGRKVKIIYIGAENSCPIIGLVRTNQYEVAEHFTEVGKFNGHSGNHICDLISEWVDKPQIDRSVLPPWIKAVAMDENGSWFGYMYRPFRVSSVWITNSEVNNDHCYIPPSHAPKWSGDWRESLLVFED